MTTQLVFVVGLVLSFFVEGQDPSKGHDWSQWQGPGRNNHCLERNLLTSWPKDGPTILWKINDLGEGYSSPTVARGRIFGLSYQGKDEVVWARDVDMGKPLWTRVFAKANREVDYHQGSRGSVTVDDDLLYALGVSGDLVCVNVKDGTPVWSKLLIKEFGGTLPFYRESYGYAESPLIHGNLVLVTPGGTENTIVALDKRNGSLVWRASVPDRYKGASRAAYSSIVAGKFPDGVQFVQFLQGGLVGITLQGQLAWRWDKPSNDIANCTTPLILNDLVFATSGYGKGCGLARIEAGPKVNELYFNKQLKNVHGGVVLVDGHVYGNSDPGMLVCLDFKTGKSRWSERSTGRGGILHADGMLYFRSEDGPMLLVKANPAEYMEMGRFLPPHRSKFNTWARPVIAHGRLYLRDQESLICYDIKKR